MQEATWVRQLQQGDRTALAPLYAAYAMPAIRTAFLITRSQAAAEDAVQEGFVQVLRTIAALRDPAAFRSWFYRIVINAAKRSARKAARLRPLFTSDEEPDLLRPAPAELAIDAEEIDQVRAALTTLSEAHREILVLRYYTELSEAEIAQALALPPGTVKSRLHRAREALAAELQRLDPEGVINRC